MFAGKRIAPRGGSLSRCTDFGIVGLENIGQSQGKVKCKAVIRPQIFNAAGNVIYDWASNIGDDGGDHTSPLYTVVVQGGAGSYTLHVTLTSTDSQGHSSTFAQDFRVVLS